MPDLNLKGEDQQWGTLSVEAPLQSKGKTWLILLISVTFVVLVGAVFLFEPRINRSEDEEILQPESAVKIYAAADSLLLDSLMRRALVRYAPTEPESLTVVASDSSSRSTPSGPFTIQLSVWQSEWKASQEVKRLRGLGLDAYLMKSEPDSTREVWHRVRMGHHRSLEEAKRVGEKFLDTLVVGYTFEKEK